MISHVAEAVDRVTYLVQVVRELGTPLALSSVAGKVDHLVGGGEEVVVADAELMIGELELGFERVQLPVQTIVLLLHLHVGDVAHRGVVEVDSPEDCPVSSASGVDESGRNAVSHGLVLLEIGDLYLRIVVVWLVELLSGELPHPVAVVLLELEDHVVAAVAGPDVVLEAQQGARQLLPVVGLEVRPLAVGHQRLLERLGQAQRG